MHAMELLLMESFLMADLLPSLAILFIKSRKILESQVLDLAI